MQFNFDVDGTLRHGVTSVELSTGNTDLRCDQRAETTQLSDFQPLHLPVEPGYASWPPGAYLSIPIGRRECLERRRLIWTNATTNPTAEWIARQITEAFPWEQAPCYLIRDRDSSYGAIVRNRVRAMGIRDRPIAPRSPWQNGHVERLIGSIRRECLDHVLILSEAHLRRILRAYADYYNRARTHLALDKDAPLSRPVHATGQVVTIALLGGLHHQYARMA